jgi:hypothetical protein
MVSTALGIGAGLTGAWFLTDKMPKDRRVGPVEVGSKVTAVALARDGDLVRDVGVRFQAVPGGATLGLGGTLF